MRKERFRRLSEAFSPGGASGMDSVIFDGITA